MSQPPNLSISDEGLFAEVIAVLCFICNDQIDIEEAMEVIDDFLRNRDLNVESVVDLGAWIRAEAILDPNRVVWQ